MLTLPLPLLIVTKKKTPAYKISLSLLLDLITFGMGSDQPWSRSNGATGSAHDRNILKLLIDGKANVNASNEESWTGSIYNALGISTCDHYLDWRWSKDEAHPAPCLDSRAWASACISSYFPNSSFSDSSSDSFSSFKFPLS
eukprot:g59176.t1